MAALTRAAAAYLAAAAIALASIISGAAPASAHANLLFTSPASDSTTATAPQSLTLLFDEPVSISGNAISVTGPNGDVAVGPAVLSHEDRALELPLKGTSARGVYSVQWQITARDGDVMAGSYRYAVGPAVPGLDGGQTAESEGTWPTAVLRGLLFAALAAALGERAAAALTRRLPAAPQRTRSWLAGSTSAGLAASAGLAVLLAGGGSLGAGVSSPDAGMLVSTRPGLLALVAVAGFAAAFAAVLFRRPGWVWLPLSAVIAAEALRAHPQLADPLLGIPLTLVHLTAGALWAGTLFHILRTAIALRHEPTHARSAITAYSRLALWLFIAVIITGLASGLLLIPIDEVTTTDYGRALLAKIALVAAAAGLALLARAHLRRKSGMKRIRRPARAEAVSLIGVLAVSSVLTVLPMPGTADAPLAFPPPASGPVVPAAALAGTVGVNARASSGQLVVQLLTSEIYDSSGRVQEPAFELTGALVNPDGTEGPLRFRACGTGCFVSPVGWKDGSSRLSLSPVAEGWPTDDAGLTIAWPPVPADELLTEAVTAMKRVPSFTLHELVTSDTTQGLGNPMTLQMEGAEFLSRALYAKGAAAIAVKLADENGHRRIALSYPAEDAVLELVLDEDGRILRETQTAPHHLVTRTFIYPEPSHEH